MPERRQEASHMTETLRDQLAEGCKLDAANAASLKEFGYGG